MARKLTLILLITLVFALGSIKANEGNDADFEVKEGDQGIPEAKVQDTIGEKDQEKLRNTVWFSCFVIVKNYLAMNNQQVFEALKGPKYQIYYKKIIGRSLINCLNTIPPDEATKFLDNIQRQGGLGEIDLQSYFQYTGIELKAYADNKIPASLTKEELHLFNAAEELEKNMNKGRKNEDGTPVEEEENDGTPHKFEPNLAGFNLKETSSSFKFFYTIAIFGGIAVIFYIGYTYLFAEGPRSQYDKLMAEKKKKKEEKKSKSK